MKWRLHTYPSMLAAKRMAFEIVSLHARSRRNQGSGLHCQIHVVWFYINIVDPCGANSGHKGHGWTFEIGMCVVGGTNMPLAGGLQTRNQCRRLLQSPAVQSLSSNHLFLALGRPPQYPSATHSVGLSLPSGLKVIPPTHISHHQQFRVVPTYKTSHCNDISGASRVIGRNLDSFQI